MAPVPTSVVTVTVFQPPLANPRGALKLSEVVVTAVGTTVKVSVPSLTATRDALGTVPARLAPVRVNASDRSLTGSNSLRSV